MENYKFDEANIEIAKNQNEYHSVWGYTEGWNVVTCYKLNLWERLKLLFTGKLWLEFVTFGKPLQAHLPTVNKKDVLNVG